MRPSWDVAKHRTRAYHFRDGIRLWPDRYWGCSLLRYGYRWHNDPQTAAEQQGVGRRGRMAGECEKAQLTMRCAEWPVCDASTFLKFSIELVHPSPPTTGRYAQRGSAADSKESSRNSPPPICRKEPETVRFLLVFRFGNGPPGHSQRNRQNKLAGC